jgi:hypothetical protein
MVKTGNREKMEKNGTDTRQIFGGNDLTRTTTQIQPAVDPVPQRPSIVDFLVGMGEAEPYTEEELQDREKNRLKRADLAKRIKEYEEDTANKERREEAEAQRIKTTRHIQKDNRDRRDEENGRKKRDW